MPSNFEILRLSNSDWRTYKSLRIAALRDSPDAFGSTLASALTVSDADWEKRISTASSVLDLPLFARVQGKGVGLAWGAMIEDDITTAHLFQMWVALEARGAGIGAALVAKTIEWARQNHAKRMMLSVTAADTPAWRMYLSAGFQAFGDLEPLRPDSDILVQPMRLEL
ncbi:MAG: GNAT family N-acetyltransferase [Pseudomonadota bacterium]